TPSVSQSARRKTKTTRNLKLKTVLTTKDTKRFTKCTKKNKNNPKSETKKCFNHEEHKAFHKVHEEKQKQPETRN
ncbi:MAG TPA: hypothetical protein VFU15_01945, partial [Bacteroidia bacterium]|nr:hypothetical protein [Bacteroidia bacterium]